MNVTRLISTVLAAAVVSGGIGVAIAQSATPQNPAPERDSGATAPQTQIAAAPADNSSSGTSSSMAADNSASNSGSSEPAPQADRG